MEITNMKGSKEYVEEDWERVGNTEEGYLREAEFLTEERFWEWYRQQPGDVKRIKEEEEPVMVINNYFLPF